MSMMDSYVDRTRCHTGIYRRLSASQPSAVLGNFRKNMLIHPTQNRGLSVTGERRGCNPFQMATNFSAQ